MENVILVTIILNWLFFAMFSLFFSHYSENIDSFRVLRLIGINNIFLFLRASLYSYSPANNIFQAIAYTALTSIIVIYLCWWLHYYYGIKIQKDGKKEIKNNKY